MKVTSLVSHLTSYSLTLHARDISFWFDDTCVFTQLSFCVSSGHVLVLNGRNGAGKSTLLGILSGLTSPSTGSVQLDQTSWNSKHLCTTHALYPLSLWSLLIGHRQALKEVLTPEENLRFAYACLRNGGLYEESCIKDALRTVELDEGVHGLKTYHLSSGQKQRLALARLFIAHRPLWLLDEPTIGLDSTGHSLLHKAIKKHREQGGIVIIATHDIPTSFIEEPFVILNLNNHNRDFPPPTGLFSLGDTTELALC